MVCFTETLNVSRPMMDGLDQMQRADGMVSEGRKALSALWLCDPREFCASHIVRAKPFSTRGCCHVDIVTLMPPVTAGMMAGNGEVEVHG